MILTEVVRPRLACEVSARGGHLVLARDGLEFTVEPAASSAEELAGMLRQMDGTASLEALGRGRPEAERTRLASVVRELDEHQLVDDTAQPRLRTGVEALLDLEDLANDLLERRILVNPFWIAMRGPAGQTPRSVFYGLAIENYQFLFRESLFDSPVLSFVPSTKVRLIVNQFYASEYGHDELVMGALNAVGITREEMDDSLPLPETLALCNALAYWAASDPLFFFVTLGILEGKDQEVDQFVDACERNGLAPGFIEPMRKHAEINRDAEHGNMSRILFKEIPFIDDATFERLRRQTHLFVEMYDAFYTAIHDHYVGAEKLVRRMTDI